MSGLSEGEVDSIRADLLREMAGDEDSVDWAMRYIGKHVTAIVGAREAAWRGERGNLVAALHVALAYTEGKHADLEAIEGAHAVLDWAKDAPEPASDAAGADLSDGGASARVVVTLAHAEDCEWAQSNEPCTCGADEWWLSNEPDDAPGLSAMVEAERARKARTEAREQDPHTDWPTRGSKG